MLNIQIKRNNQNTIVLPLESAIYTDVLMGEHSLVFTLSSAQELDIQIGDTLTYKGYQMTINKEPEVTRSHKLDYVIRFEGERHTLSRFLIKDEGALTFDYLADLETYMFMFLESINTSDLGWTVGALEEIEPFALSFENVDHLSALNMIAEAAGCEWIISGKQITIKKSVGIAHDYPLAYGKDNGLYSIKRVSIENSQIVTRAYAIGGSQNLPAGYAFKKLTLAGYLDDEDAQAIYGIREGVIESEEIFPQRTSTATAVSQINDKTYTLTDTTIDFDLDGQRITGVDAKIVFKSGSLNGQEFKILSYNHATKTIRYEANEDSNGNLIPFGVTLAEVGDKYTLVGIRMPESYVTAALAELTAKRLEYLNSNKAPRVVYDVEIDPLDLKRKAMNIKPGDVLPFTDTKIGLDENLRVTSVRYSATFPELLFNGMTYEIEVGNDVTYNRAQKIEKDIKENREVAVSTSHSMIEYNRLQSLATRQFRSMVFDPDNNLQGTFKALMIEAMSAVFGTDSQNFDLVGIFIKPNADNNPNKITFTAGELAHYSYSIEGLGNTWEMNPYSNETLVANTSYYVSAKCSKTALTGSWVLSTMPIGTNDEPGYWHFNLGVISSVIEGQRFANITKGYTFISGGQIITESLIARFFQTATSGARTSINVLPSDMNDPTCNLDHFIANAIRQYHQSGRVSMYEGIVKNLTITVSGSPRTINGHAKVIFKDSVGSPIHYVIDSTTADGFQYVSSGDSVQYYEIRGHRLITNSLDHTATDSAILEQLFTYYPASDIYIPNSLWCGYYERAIYALSLGLSADSGSIWQRVATSGTTYVTANNGTTPIASGWYYRLGYYMDGNATYTDDSMIIFDLNLQLQYINSSGEIQVTKDLLINNIQWHQGGLGANTCNSFTPQIQIQ